MGFVRLDQMMASPQVTIRQEDGERRSCRRSTCFSIVVLLLAGCSSDSDQLGGNVTTAPPVPVKLLSVAQVERAFRSGGINLVRQRSGSWRISNKAQFEMCGELHSRDYRIDITICHRPDQNIVLAKRLLETANGRQFRTHPRCAHSCLSSMTTGVRPCLSW